MKKTYINPTSFAVELNSGAICQSLIIGSGGSERTTGNGTDLVKEDRITVTDKSLWDDEW